MCNMRYLNRPGFMEPRRLADQLGDLETTANCPALRAISTSISSGVAYGGPKKAGRTYAETLHWGMRWEGLRSRWFSRFGRWADEEECLARYDHLEREYAEEVKQN